MISIYLIMFSSCCIIKLCWWPVIWYLEFWIQNKMMTEIMVMMIKITATAFLQVSSSPISLRSSSMSSFSLISQPRKPYQETNNMQRKTKQSKYDCQKSLEENLLFCRYPTNGLSIHAHRATRPGFSGSKILGDSKVLVFGRLL